MGRMKFTQEQLNIVLRLLPEYELDKQYIEHDLIILNSRVHGEEISVQMRLVNSGRTYVCDRIKEMKGYYDRMRLDHPEYNLPPRPETCKEEEYMNTH